MEDDRIDELIKQVRELTLQVQRLERVIDHTTNPVPLIAGIDFFVFAQGDRVRILNSVKKPVRWDNAKEWNKDKARYATVTRIQDGRIYIITDNGVPTWRSANNLRCANKHE
jgi:hypothetical protein